MDDDTPGTSQEQPAGVRMSEVLALPDPLCQLMTWMMRRGACSLDDIAERIGEDTATARQLVTELMDRGFVTEDAEVGATFRPQPAVRSGRRSTRAVWRALDDLDAR